jgi:WD40 repeat protein
MVGLIRDLILASFICLLVPVNSAWAGGDGPRIPYRSFDRIVPTQPDAVRLSRTPILRLNSNTHLAGISRISASRDGKILATASDDGSVRVWSRSGELLRTLRVPIVSSNDGSARAVAVSPDGKLLAIAGGERLTAQFVYLYDLSSGAQIRVLHTLPSVVTFSVSGMNFQDCQFTARGNPQIFNQCIDEAGERTGKRIMTALDLEFSPDGKFLGAGLGNALRGGLLVWRTTDWGVHSQYFGGASVSGLAFEPDGRLVTVSLNGELRLYDPAFKLIRRRSLFPVEPSGVSFSPDGKMIAVGDRRRTRVYVVGAADLEQAFVRQIKQGAQGSLGSVAWSRDGAYLYAAGQYPTKGRSRLLRWSQGGRGQQTSFSGPENTVLDLAALPEGRLAYVTQRPVLGVIDAKGEHIFRKAASIVDMRGKLGKSFLISNRATRVRFSLAYDDGFDPWLFDVSSLRFVSWKKTRGLRRASTKGLRIRHHEWEPRIGNRRIDGVIGTTRSFAWLPGRKSFVLGTSTSISRHDRKGKKIWAKNAAGETWGVIASRRGGLVVAAYGDGTIRWHRARDGQELLAFFVDRTDKRWVAWTPKGYYAASVGGERLIGWQVNRRWNEAPDFFPVDRFREVFYRPDIVKLVLKMLDEEKAIKAANKKLGITRGEERIRELLPPVVDLKEVSSNRTDQGTTSVIKLRARSLSDAPVESVQLRINGRPAGARAAIALNRAENSYKSFTVTLNTPCEDAVVSVLATSGDRTSQARQFQIKCQAGPGAQKGRLLALLVGVNAYPNNGSKSLKLKHAVKDATDFAKILSNQKGLLYEDVVVRTLMDEQATRANIIEQLEWLLAKTRPGDTALLFLAGHGLTDQRNRFFFLPINVDLKKLVSTTVRESDILEPLSGVRGNVLVFLDACHSGASLSNGGLQFRSANLTGITNRLVDDERGVVLFASSTAGQPSYESDSLSNGVFTFSLLQGINGKAEDPRFSNGKIETNELDSWLFNHVRQLTRNRQIPIMIKPRAVPHFPVALIRK